MQDAKYEARYLLTILSAVINNRKPPVSVRKLNWENLFKMADFHKVANVVHYAVLGLDEEIPAAWKRRFFEKYQESVIENERLQNAVEVLTWQLEKNKIRCILPKGEVMSQCYLHPEMQLTDRLEIYTERGRERQIGFLMESMDYIKIENRENRGLLFHKVPGIKVVFYNKISFENKKMKKYYRSQYHQILLTSQNQYVHNFNADEMYLYLISNITKNYASAEIDIRAIMDLWSYYMHYQNELNWNHIRKELRKMGIQNFADHLLILAGIWFGGAHSDEIELYDAMESYILTKGAEGRETSSKLLPLTRQVADFYERDEKREWVKAQIKWIAPNREYMSSIYPVIKKIPALIVFCWILRILRSLWFALKSKVKKEVSRIWGECKKVQEELKRMLKEWKEK